jgi:hypothetical protein
MELGREDGCSGREIAAVYIIDEDGGGEEEREAARRFGSGERLRDRGCH